MFLYKFGYGSYEDSQFSEVCHVEKFTEEEFDRIVTNAIIRALQGVISGKYRVYVHDDGVSYESIHEYVLEELKKDGFETIEYQATWACFGWPSLVDKQSWGKQRGPELDKIFWKIPEDVRNTIVQMGKEEEREDRKRYDVRYREVLSV